MTTTNLTNFATSDLLTELVTRGVLTAADADRSATKAARAAVRAAKKQRQAELTTAVAAFLADFMKPGVGYSVKPQGKANGRAILPWLQSTSDITRDECLNALRALREQGVLETNQAHVRNNCQIRWFLSGTYEAPVVEEAPAADEQ
jgi:hypothetical protein